MKSTLIAFTATCCSLALVGCQEYDFGYTSKEIFKGAYERNFTDRYGAIDPDETWDLSDAGGRRGHAGALTRARVGYVSVASNDGWYYVENNTLDWMKGQLPESANSKHKVNSFAMNWTKGVEFEIIPIYEGYATASWDLHMVIQDVNGTTTDKVVWSKAQDLQIKINRNLSWTPSLSESQEKSISVYFLNEFAPRIWAWNEEKGKTGTYYTGADQHANRPSMDIELGNANNKKIWEYTFKANPDASYVNPAKVQFSYGNNEFEGDFVNNGLYEIVNGNLVLKTILTQNSEWSGFMDGDDGKYASAFRSKPIRVSAKFDGTYSTGSQVSFYLKVTRAASYGDFNRVGDEMKSENRMIALLTNCPKPSNIPSTYTTYILGCEDSNGNNSDWDYNDCVFLLTGYLPEPVILQAQTVFKVEKRYMVEDLTSTGDFDFNDIVIDVKQETTVNYNVNSETNVRTETSRVTKQYAKIAYLCGTVPICAKVGNYRFPLVTAPANQEQSRKQLRGESVSNVEWGVGNVKTSLYSPMDEWKEITGWNPDANNVSIYVCWDGSKATQVEIGSLAGSANVSQVIGSEQVWTSTFPARGSVPYIIATNIADAPSDECVDISENDWWKDYFEWSAPSLAK